MARRPRLNLPHIPQHVVQRGNNRQATFFTEQDFTVYLNKVKDYSRRFEVCVIAFLLMTNDVHLLMTPTTATRFS
ncbi:transposase, partial [Pseudoalteromonas ruthenica]|uniref:transposase n=1 Tax=Pseudoalteromonas ruthenica TaxID=151081 RepID=UPI0012879958